jgi:hypothetical protein
MTSLEDMRALWKIPIPPSRNDQPSNSLARSIGIFDPDVTNMTAAIFWEIYRQQFEDISAPTELVVPVMGDFVRDKSKEKSLPWYESLFFILLTAVLASPL